MRFKLFPVHRFGNNQVAGLLCPARDRRAWLSSVGSWRAWT